MWHGVFLVFYERLETCSRSVSRRNNGTRILDRIQKQEPQPTWYSGEQELEPMPKCKQSYHLWLLYVGDEGSVFHSLDTAVSIFMMTNVRQMTKSLVLQVFQCMRATCLEGFNLHLSAHGVVALDPLLCKSVCLSQDTQNGFLAPQFNVFLVCCLSAKLMAFSRKFSFFHLAVVP